MPMTVKFTAPKINAVLAMQAAAKLGAHAGAEELLAKSQPGVPVETQRLQKSGRLTDTATGTAVGYGFDDGDGVNAPTADYAVIQSEDTDLDHPNGGGPKWLEKAMHAERAAILAAAAVPVREVFKL